MASCKFFSQLLIGNSNSRTQKNSPIGSTKAGALMVKGMFAVVAMNCWGERFTEIGTGSGLLGTIPWCVMAICNVAWEVLTMVVA